MPLVVSQDVEEYADLFDKLIKMVLINLRIFKTTGNPLNKINQLILRLVLDL